MRSSKRWRLIPRKLFILGMIHLGIGLSTAYAQATFDQNLANAG